MSLWTTEEVQETLDKIRKKISMDDTYKKFCLENPHAAIAEVSGKDLPDGLAVGFAENGEPFLHIEVMNLFEGELTDEDLERVIGGLTNPAGVRAWWQMVPVRTARLKVDMPTGIAGIRA